MPKKTDVENKRKTESESGQIATRTLPNSSDAEKSLLGCVIADGTIALDVCSFLSADDFYYAAHRTIFEAVQSITAGNKAVDIVTMTDFLTRNDLLGKIGGLNYLTALSGRAPSSANVSEYIEIVKRTSLMRKLIKSCSEIINDAYTAEDSVNALANAEKRIFDLGGNEVGADLAPVSKGMSEVLERLNTIKTDAEAFKGIPTGFWMLDKLTNGLHGGELIVIAGRPGTGKSSFAMNIVENAALKNKSCAVFSLEMPRIQIAQRLLCSCSGVALSKMASGEFADNEKDWKKLYETATKLSNFKIFIDDSSLVTPAQVLSKCRRLKSKEGLDLVLIDYIQLMTIGRKAENRQQEISEISRNLKILAKELDVPVVALSQMSRQIESRPGRPQLSDLRESGAIEQDADIVMFIHREKTEEDAPNKDDRMLIVAKHRNGALDDIPLKWIGELVKFVSYESDDMIKIRQYEENKKQEKRKERETAKAEKAGKGAESVPTPINPEIVEIIKKDTNASLETQVSEEELAQMALGVPEDIEPIDYPDPQPPVDEEKLSSGDSVIEDDELPF